MIELPLEHHSNSDSGGGGGGGEGSPITVQVTNEDGETIGQQQQQVTAQVALVQSESPDETGQHFFTVTGELLGGHVGVVLMRDLSSLGTRGI